MKTSAAESLPLAKTLIQRRRCSPFQELKKGTFSGKNFLPGKEKGGGGKASPTDSKEKKNGEWGGITFDWRLPPHKKKGRGGTANLPSLGTVTQEKKKKGK